MNYSKISSLSEFDDEKYPMTLYYDIDFLNVQKDNEKPPKVEFTETRTNPFIDNPSLYNCSIIRFNLETGNSLPVIIPEALIGQMNVNKLKYSITLTYKNFEYRQYLTFIPQCNDEPLPNPPIKYQDLTSNYYFIFNYSFWIKIVNKALTDCFNGLKAAVIAGGDSLPTNNIPFMEFDPTDNLSIINADVLGFDLNLTNPIKMYFNTPLYNLFATFESFRNGFIAENGKNFQLILQNIGTNLINLNTYNAIQLIQDYSTTGVWCPVSSIVFTTNLPVIPTQVATPKIFGVESELYAVQNNNNLADILTDFQSQDNDYRTEINFVPSGQYRFFGLQGINPIYSMKINVFWKDKWAQLHPFYLQNGMSANIKILFQRKDFNSYKLIKNN